MLADKEAFDQAAVAHRSRRDEAPEPSFAQPHAAAAVAVQPAPASPSSAGGARERTVSGLSC